MLNREQWIKDNFSLAQNVCLGSGIFPEVLLSQAIIESQAAINGIYYPGQSVLASKYNNYFGIQANTGWNGTKIKMTDKNAAGQTYQTYFRTYRTKADSFKDYVNFLKVNPRYKQALQAQTPQEQINLIAGAGYAENPNYKNLLLSVLNTVKSAKPGSYNISSLGLLFSILTTIYILK